MHKFPRPVWLAAIVLGVVLLLGIDVARRFSLDASMEHFLPGQGERALYRVSREVMDSTLTKRMVLTVGLESNELSREERRAALVGIAQRFEERAETIGGIRSVTRGPEKGLEEDFYALYFPRRFSFLSLDPEADQERYFSDAGLQGRAHLLKEKLASPEGTLLRPLAPRDPWLLFADLLGRLESAGLGLDVEAGQFFSKKSDADTVDFAVLFLELEKSALDADAQEPLLAQLSALSKSLTAPPRAKLIVESSGANRFAVDTQRRMKSDVERIYSLSTLGLFLLFLVLFRSLRRIVFLVIPIVTGLVVASWVSLVVYGSLHALTLGFGGALIGVALDYPVHVLCHHDLDEPGRSSHSTVRRLLPTLSLAAGTTVAGLLGLAWTAFPGIRQIALFTGVGVAAALSVTLLTHPLLPPSGKSPRVTQALASGLVKLLPRLRKSRLTAALILASALAMTIWGLVRVRFAPGLDSLAPLDPALLAEDARVQKRIGEPESGRLAIALAPHLEEALTVNEHVARTLSRLRADGKVGDFTSAALFIRSRALQQRAETILKGTPDLAVRTKQALEKAGFVPEAFPDLDDELTQHPPPLTWSDLKKSRLAELVSPLILRLDSEWAIVTPLRGQVDEEAVRMALEPISGAQYFSQRRLLNQAYEDLRTRTTELLLVGLLLIFCAAFLRYRDLRRAGAALLPSILAAGATVGLLSLFGVELNLLHLLGLLLVCSMGVDYGVFLVDARSEEERPALLSITIGCLSTMLSFGVLSFSSAPALRALGSSIAVGIVLSLLLAPIALLLVDKKKPVETSR